MQNAVYWQRWISAAFLERWSFIEEKLCSMNGGVTTIFFILSFKIAIRHSTQTYTFNSCKVFRKIFKEDRSALVNWRNVVLLYNNASPHSVRITRKKILDLGWSVLLYPLISIIFTVRDFYHFYSLQNALNEKKCEKVYGKFETSWILVERNQLATW